MSVVANLISVHLSTYQIWLSDPIGFECSGFWCDSVTRILCNPILSYRIPIGYLPDPMGPSYRIVRPGVERFYFYFENMKSIKRHKLILLSPYDFCSGFSTDSIGIFYLALVLCIVTKYWFYSEIRASDRKRSDLFFTSIQFRYTCYYTLVH
jgi:hypothetical protein